LGTVTVRQLLEAGVHFGHPTRRWNPKMGKYVFAEKNGMYIIDLQKTIKKLKEAQKFVKEVVASGKSALFVGTKKQAQAVVEEEAKRCGAFYVTNRWLGGMLTNFSTVRQSIVKLEELERMIEDGVVDKLSKKEGMKLKKKYEKRKKVFEGIRGMTSLPGVVFVVDPKKERIAVLEAKKLEIPVVAIVDTNCDPDIIDYAIPGNDDAIRSIKLITSLIADAVIEGKLMAEKERVELEQAQEIPIHLGPRLSMEDEDMEEDIYE